MSSSEVARLKPRPAEYRAQPAYSITPKIEQRPRQRSRRPPSWATFQTQFMRSHKISLAATLDMPPAICYPRPRSDGGVIDALPAMDGRIAQLVEQLTLNQRVQGSSPCAPTIFPTIVGRKKEAPLRAAIAQLVRALDCGSRGPPFKPGWRYHFIVAARPASRLNSARLASRSSSRTG